MKDIYLIQVTDLRFQLDHVIPKIFGYLKKTHELPKMLDCL